MDTLTHPLQGRFPYHTYDASVSSFQYGLLTIEEGKWMFSHRSLQGDCQTHLFNDSNKPALLEVLDRLGANGWEYCGNMQLCSEAKTHSGLVFIRRRSV